MAEHPDRNRTEGRVAARGLRAAVVRLAVLGGLAAGLGGCATGASSSMFVDPAKYDLYDCPQLVTARKTVNARVVELEGLMAKAETGAAGGLVSGLAYQTDYLTARGQRDLIDEKLAKGNCSTTEAAPAATAAPAASPKSKRRH